MLKYHQEDVDCWCTLASGVSATTCPTLALPLIRHYWKYFTCQLFARVSGIPYISTITLLSCFSDLAIGMEF